MYNLFEDAVVVVTGAVGTVGSELIRQLLLHPVREIRAIDNNESEVFYFDQTHRKNERVHVYFGDVRDEDHLSYLFRGARLVFHAAALKHVPISEKSPFSAVRTNVNGTQNVISAAFANDVKKVLFTSSDKAVNPTNVMGTTKLMGERLITSSNTMRRGGEGPILASTRFGNVAGSKGSVVPLFCKQIQAGGPVTLTSPRMTRFMMTLEKAVQLVIESIVLAQGGEIFVTKMPVVNIRDLCDTMIEMVAPIYGKKPGAIDVSEIGPRAGEKMYEELMNEEESAHAFEAEDLFIVLPALREYYDEQYQYPNLTLKAVSKVYNSANFAPLDKARLREFLLQPGVLPEEIVHELQRRGGS